jgi:hypothetical protein
MNINILSAMNMDGFTSEQSGALQFSEENPKRIIVRLNKRFNA